jgi:hypothetical protein
MEAIRRIVRTAGPDVPVLLNRGRAMDAGLLHGGR